MKASSSQAQASRRTKFAAVAAVTASLLLLPGLVKAAGEYPCETTTDCARYASNGDISNNSTCVADPLNPEYGYCGYVGAPCGTSDDCDYGVCKQGQCRGYMGDSCTQPLDCLAWFGCSDGICGGSGAACDTNGNEDCFSNSCVSEKCTAPPTSGMPEGSGCSVDANCATGTCDSESFICTNSLVAAPGASQAARMKTKRNGGAANPKDRRGKIHAWFRGHQFCPLGQTACGTATGFECIDTLRSLESCGGCPPLYASNTTSSTIGTDCTNLPNVDEVICSNGHCTVLSCLPGSMLSEDGHVCLSR